jgi:UDP-N-acetylglucosamine diphosphorylase / glucose-1-phosphate thymidylyltransferase / UDP-N-acetylgalactosamine diphosphorylase / glucosamine-1-phosphate N-acetyltransferase / galactosamine-1-phosphate N-acetyltransferase
MSQSNLSEQFAAEKFFSIDTKSQYIADLFTQANFVWDPIAKLGEYITFLFESGTLKPNYSENVYVAHNAEVDTTARVIGPAIILDNARVGFNAFIRGNVFLGERSVMKHSSELKNCIIMNDSHMSHFNYVGDSIVGNNVDMGLGSVTANYRLDKNPVKVRINHDEKIQTSLRKFGAIIGDKTSIGANSVLNPGTVLGKNCVVFPLTSVLGVYPDNSSIK